MTDALPFGADIVDALRNALAGRGLELYHVGWKPGRSRGVLTLTIDREAGVTLDDCEAASHAASELLDGLDEPKTAYVLEVESPGLDRPLYTIADCVRFTGKRVKVQLKVKVDGAGRLKGVLEAVDGNTLTILDEDQRRRYTVQFGDVKLARLIPEL